MAAEARRRLIAFAGGISRYNTFSRKLEAAEDRFPGSREVWRQGTTRLLDYGGVSPAAKTGRPVLVVPSLINRAHILDLDSKHSLLRALAKSGARPFLVDWDAPGEAEKTFTLSDYIAGRLAGALDAAVEISGGPVSVVGYCMGGTLAVPLAQLVPEKVAALAVLAAPWDFGAMTSAPVRLLQSNRAAFDALISAHGELPVDALQAMFTSLSPTLSLNKFTAFSAADGRTAKTRRFVRLEDWLNDGIPLVAAVARECLFDWYGRNTPGRGLWRVAGDWVEPRRVRCSALVVTPERDIIVPPESARPLGDKLPRAEIVTLPAGHIGMVAGRNGPSRLYPLLADWLKAHSA